MNYLLSSVNNLTDLETLRLIRNECREYMTRYTQEITHKQQQKWFSSLDKNKNFPFLFIEKNTNLSIGYGFINCDSDICYLSAGLLKEYRGSGIGKILFKLLIEQCTSIRCKSIELEVLKTNIRAYTLYKNLGFKVVSEEENKYLMKLF